MNKYTLLFHLKQVLNTILQIEFSVFHFKLLAFPVSGKVRIVPPRETKYLFDSEHEKYI